MDKWSSASEIFFALKTDCWVIACMELWWLKTWFKLSAPQRPQPVLPIKFLLLSFNLLNASLDIFISISMPTSVLLTSIE